MMPSRISRLVANALVATAATGLLAPALYAQGSRARFAQPVVHEPLPLPKDVGTPDNVKGPAASQDALTPPALTLDDLVRTAVFRNPVLRQAQLNIDAHRGRAVQAGLYPNPSISFIFDELGDRQGPPGINTLPLVTQEIVTARKLKLSRAVAEREVDQAVLALTQQRYQLITAVRQAYFDVLSVQRRIEILTQLAKLAGQGVENAQKLLAAEQAAEADVLQFEIDLNRFRSQLEAAERELVPAWGQLAAAVGAPDLPVSPLLGTLDAPVPIYDFEQSRLLVAELHPEVLSAQVGVTRAEIALKRARVEAVPNVTFATGYVRQNQNKSDDFTIQFSMPIPVWNRNQGNIRAAEAEVGHAIEGVGRTQNELTGRLATAFRQYAAAQRQAERYRTKIIPAARRAYDLTAAGFKGGQFEYLRVIVSQRSIAEANLEYVRFATEQWRAASEIAGLLQQDQWPHLESMPTTPEKK